jgi:hypothetical protein
MSRRSSLTKYDSSRVSWERENYVQVEPGEVQYGGKEESAD